MVGMRNKATDGFFLLLPTLMLFSYQTLCQAQAIKIGFKNTATITISENQQFEIQVCLQPSETLRNYVSFSISASPTSQYLSLYYPRIGYINAGSTCYSADITTYNNYRRDDTMTFLITLASTSIGVDENQDRFILHVTDVDTGTSGLCPNPTVVNGHETSCNSYERGSTCSFECDDGHKIESGSYSRTCSDTFRWSGLPLFCIQSSCLAPTVVNGNKVSCNNSHEIGSTCHFNCNDEYIRMSGDYVRTCSSTFQWSGHHLYCIADECRNNPCLNGGLCVYRVNGYQCTCVAGYTGTTCETDTFPPTISNCPTSGITVYIEMGDTQRRATWTEPTATDASGVVTVTKTQSPGDSFPVGSTLVRYDFEDGFSNTKACQFWVYVRTVEITCPSPTTVPYQDRLSYISPTCFIHYSRTSNSRQSSCSPRSGSVAEEDDVVVCSCNNIRHINCSFQVTVKTKIEQCPQSRTISPGSQLNYNVPRCMNSARSRLASCSPPVGFTANTTDISVTCTCPQDPSVQCSFDTAVDCIELQNNECSSPGVSCDCMNESCDPDTGICSSSCTIVNICPARIQSVSLSQVNPSSKVDITCTLRGSRAILNNFRFQLSSKRDELDQNGIRELTVNEDRNADAKVESTFRVKNVTSEKNLYCILLQQRNYFIGGVRVIDFVHELPVLNDALMGGNVSNTSITISWRAWDPTLDDGDPPIVAYIPYYRKNASDAKWTNGSRILSNETLQFKAEGLEVDSQYDFSVATVRDGENGEGPRSKPLTVKTSCNVPDVASSVKVGVTSSNIVNVSWQLPPGEMLCSTGVTSYKVYYRIEGSVEKKPELAGTVDDVNTRWLIIDDKLLQPGSLYTFFVTVTTDQESEFRESEPIQVSSDDEDQENEFRESEPETVPFPSGSSAGNIVAVISIIIFLIILVLVILLIIKRKRDMKAHQAPRPVDNTYDNVSGSLTKEKWSAGATNATKPAFQMQLAERDDREKISLESFSVDEEGSPDEIIYGNLEPPQPIRVAEFKDYFKQNIDKFEQEFSILRGNKKQFDWTVAENPINKKKNRFKNIYTYDHSRVVLKTLPDQEGSDYYNASFIKNASGVKAYIAAQAPNKSSVDDFIRMIWEQNVTTIVMVANLFEEGKERCHQYWPETEGSHKSFGSVTVTWLKTRQFSDFVIRILSFKKGKKTHEVQQLHFLVWPDKDTPEHGTGLIEFVKQSKQIHHKKKYPMLVHCSAGIGRTGTFISLSCMMDVLRDREFIDVFAFVNKMRENRINMVQTSKQYVFLYKCLNEYHLTHQTEMSVHQMTGLNVDSHRGMLLGEFELLNELGHSHRKDTVKNCVGKKRENIARNRVRNMVPSNRNRVFLMSRGQSNEDGYINASYVKSFQKKDAFITTQSPLPNTIEDFWRMVYDVKSPLIVMLNQLDQEDKTCVQYWPDRGSNEYGNMYITWVATERQPDYIQRTFEVKHVDSKEVLSVIHMQLEEWRPDINLRGIVGIIKDVDIMQKRGQYTQPIVIHCINGFERSGVMVTVKSEFERLAVTDRIDVFSTVKKLRDQHEHMLKNKDDYILCYHLLKAYLVSTDSNYENSEDLRHGGVMM